MSSGPFQSSRVYEPSGPFEFKRALLGMMSEIPTFHRLSAILQLECYIEMDRFGEDVVFYVPNPYKVINTLISCDLKPFPHILESKIKLPEKRALYVKFL